MAEDAGKKRPHCGKCHSTAVYSDRDASDGTLTIACRICGNRYPGGFGFYMREVDVKKPCNNCKRDKTIVNHGLCWTCERAYASVPDGPGAEEAREEALAEAKRRIDAGLIKKTGLQGRPRVKKGPDPLPPDDPGKLTGAIPGAQDEKTTQGKFDAADLTWEDPTSGFLIDRQLLPLWERFTAYAAKQWRTPRTQLLFMIEQVVAEDGGARP